MWGLVDHIKNVADRFAAQGFAVIAPNLFHSLSIEEQVDQKLRDEMANPETRDEAQKKLRAIIAPIMAPEFAASPEREASSRELGDFLKGRVARYKLPRHFIRVDALPRTALGKVQKSGLLQEIRDRLPALLPGS